MEKNTPDSNNRRFSRWFAVSLILGCATPYSQAWALCNGGITVAGPLEVSASCDGGGTTPLTLNTGAAVTVDSGVNVTNSGAGRPSDAISILSTATSSSIINLGNIESSNQLGITDNGVLNSVTNFGTIIGDVHRGIVVSGSGQIGTITNVGTILGSQAGITTNTTATINTINNLQGVGGAGALSTTDTTGQVQNGLPSNYNIIIRSTSQYGQLQVLGTPGVSMAMNFNIYGNTGTTLVSGVAASTITKGAYEDVLQGFTTLNGISGTTGSYQGLNYALVADTSISGDWNLVVSQGAFTSALTSNQQSIQGTFNRLAPSATGNFGNLITNLGTLSSSGQRQAFDQLASSVGSDIQTAGIANTRTMMSGMQSRLSGTLGGAGAEAPLRTAGFDEVQIVDASDADWASLVKMNVAMSPVAWIEGLGNFNSIKGNATAPGMHSTLGGGAVGIESRLDIDSRVGTMFGAANNSFGVDDVAQSGSQNSYVVGLYGSAGALGGSGDHGVILDGTVLASYNTAKSDRQISLLAETARGQTDGYSFAVSGGVSYPITLDEGSVFTPRAGLAYTYNQENGYTETGAASANLFIDSNSQNLLQTSLGVTAKHKFEIQHLTDSGVPDILTPEVSAGWLHEMIDPRTSVTESFDGIASSSFSSSSASPSRDAAALGFALSFNPADTATTVFARYDADLSSNQTDQSVIAGLKYSW